MRDLARGPISDKLCVRFGAAKNGEGSADRARTVNCARRMALVLAVLVQVFTSSLGAQVTHLRRRLAEQRRRHDRPHHERRSDRRESAQQWRTRGARSRQHTCVARRPRVAAVEAPEAGGASRLRRRGALVSVGSRAPCAPGAWLDGAHRGERGAVSPAVLVGECSRLGQPRVEARACVLGRL